MQLAFVLYKYFPFGGLQRDFMRIALECQARGHAIRVYTPIWEGEVPAGFDVRVAPIKAFFNHHRNEKFSAWLAADLARPLNVWLKLDSGMHRLGFSVDGLRECHGRLKGAAQVGELNLISHFACADERGHALTETQLERYAELLELPFEHCSLANSAAVLTLPQAHMAWIRPGIMLYGATPFAELSARELGLKPVMTLTGALIAVRDVPVGESVGYGASWVAQRPSRIGTVSCGYADGYPRTAPSGTSVVIHGQRVPLAGRVSMDMLAVDLTDLAQAQLGDAVELWGAQMPIDELAQACGTIGYELLTKVTGRVPRRYIG